MVSSVKISLKTFPEAKGTNSVQVSVLFDLIKQSIILQYYIFTLYFSAHKFLKNSKVYA